MMEILLKKLYKCLEANYPELLLQLEQDSKVYAYLSNQIDGVKHLFDSPIFGQDFFIEEACMELLTKSLPPSRFNYICNVLADDFEQVYNNFQASGLLKFEVINLIQECSHLFDSFGFTDDDEGNRELGYAITGAVSGYLEKQYSVRENSVLWDTTANKN